MHEIQVDVSAVESIQRLFESLAYTMVRGTPAYMMSFELVQNETGAHENLVTI